MKKEELQKKIGELESKISRFENNDKYVRQEFAKAFRWGTPPRGLYQDEFSRRVDNWNWQTPTWEQIFVEVGKLESLMDYRDFEGSLSEIETRLEHHIQQEKRDNLDKSGHC